MDNDDFKKALSVIKEMEPHAKSFLKKECSDDSSLNFFISDVYNKDGKYVKAVAHCFAAFVLIASKAPKLLELNNSSAIVSAVSDIVSNSKIGINKSFHKRFNSILEFAYNPDSIPLPLEHFANVYYETDKLLSKKFGLESLNINKDSIIEFKAELAKVVGLVGIVKSDDIWSYFQKNNEYSRNAGLVHEVFGDVGIDGSQIAKTIIWDLVEQSKSYLNNSLTIKLLEAFYSDSVSLLCNLSEDIVNGNNIEFQDFISRTLENGLVEELMFQNNLRIFIDDTDCNPSKEQILFVLSKLRSFLKTIYIQVSQLLSNKSKIDKSKENSLNVINQLQIKLILDSLDPFTRKSVLYLFEQKPIEQDLIDKVILSDEMVNSLTKMAIKVPKIIIAPVL